MGNITLYKDYSSEVTLIKNDFIDIYMTEANDAQIKVYLYLLRKLSGGSPFSVGDIADRFNYTEKDVLRALKYWDKLKLISLSFNSGGELTCIQILDPPKADAAGQTGQTITAVPAAPAGHAGHTLVTGYAVQPDSPNKTTEDRIKMVDFSRKTEYTAEELVKFKDIPEISQLLFITETYLNKTLRPDEISSILFMYDSYGFSADLIEYLIEYCANNRKKSIKYIESVARTWAETGITTVDEARARTGRAPREVYEVFKAFGISGRDPIEPEISYVVKWNRVYGFSMDIICEACSRTIMKIHSASFEYADTILTNWKDAGVTALSDIEKLDAMHAKEAVKSPGKKKGGKPDDKPGQGSGFNGFNQRKYDYDELEKDALYNQG
ncbi:MAG: DnaD domain protein [Lachnospiraceae bacterium]|nr:DnaD domain protein [Lachnospiraceae bacterium]